MEKDHSELVTQLEYYFSDKNLEYDEFFFGEIEASAEVPFFFLTAIKLSYFCPILKPPIAVLEARDCAKL